MRRRIRRGKKVRRQVIDRWANETDNRAIELPVRVMIGFVLVEGVTLLERSATYQNTCPWSSWGKIRHYLLIQQLIWMVGHTSGKMATRKLYPASSPLPQPPQSSSHH